MADTGVVERKETQGGEHRPEHRPSAPGEAKGGFFQKHKALVIVGGAGAALLLLSKKGASTGTANPNPTIQVSGSSPRLGRGNVTGGGGGGAGGGEEPRRRPPKHRPRKHGGKGVAGGRGEGYHSGHSGSTSGSKSHPGSQGSGGKNHGNNNGNKPSGGVGLTKASAEIDRAPNPAATNSGGSGVTVHGRTFPGAQSVRVGPARITREGVAHNVTVNYGGHSDTHTSINQGQSWQDHTRNASPPSRTTSAALARVPQTARMARQNRRR